MANIMRLGGGVGGSGEIPIIANGTYDVKKYATANVNVVSNPVLLWTNASPTSKFNGQSVSVAGGYSGYLIECRYDNMNDIRTIVYVPNGVKTRITVPSATSDYYDRGAARFATGANGKVTFTGGRITGYTSDNNYFAIPTRIWGVKFTL